MFDIQNWFEEIDIHWEVVSYCMVRGTLSSLIFNQFLLISSINNYKRFNNYHDDYHIFIFNFKFKRKLIHIHDRHFSTFSKSWNIPRCNPKFILS